MKIGFYAGSFDPFTLGHLYVAKIASKLFDKLVVGIGVNENKIRRFDKQKMKDAMQKLFEAEKLNNIEVIIYDGLTVHAAKQKNASFLVRGIRNDSDYEVEKNMAETNKKLSGIETIYMVSSDIGMISSTMVYNLLKEGKDVSKYLPPQILEVVK